MKKNLTLQIEMIEKEQQQKQQLGNEADTQACTTFNKMP